MKYTNPVIPGFYPDPSVCRVGEDYYLVNSSFEYTPGVPIWHSKNLVEWEMTGHCIEPCSKLKYLEGGRNNTGIYAPVIRYNNGTFYMITTNVGGEQHGNFYIYTDDINGEWSEPIFVDAPGIDPSLFFDDDGKAYYTGSDNMTIFIQEIDIKTGKFLGERVTLCSGYLADYAEGPHICKINGWYYLMLSEGGTERCHMITIARSRDIYGKYVPYENNPIISNRGTVHPIQAAGHADLVQDQYGDWWAVCLGIRQSEYPAYHNLGRETMLVPVKFNDEGWPVFAENGKLLDIYEVSNRPLVENTNDILNRRITFFDDFKEKNLNPEWNYIFNKIEEMYKSGDGELVLYGNDKGLSDNSKKAFAGVRQKNKKFMAQVTLEISDCNNGEAGLTIYLNSMHHYEVYISYKNEKPVISFRRRIGSLWKVENEIEISSPVITLKAESDEHDYIFLYKEVKEEGEIEEKEIEEKEENTKWTEAGRGECRYLSTEVGGAFTGNYIGLYAVNSTAAFKNFSYNGEG